MTFITGLQLSKAGNNAICVVCDRLSKMVYLLACSKRITASQLAHLYIKEVWRLHGCPTSIVSDRDSKFISTFWRHFIEAIGAKLNMSSAYHPQTDGQTERTNRTIEDYLRHYLGPFHTEWEELLPVGEFALNNAKQDSSGVSPFYAQLWARSGYAYVSGSSEISP